MVEFNTIILQFAQAGEKTGWTYIEIPEDVAQELKPGHKQTFRVKGKLDNYAIEKIALLPMGDGNFIMPLNLKMRKGIQKNKGAMLAVSLEYDERELPLSADLMQCLEDEPEAFSFFNSLAKSQQRYFSKWVEDAKTESTKANRIAQSINGLLLHQDYGTMLRALKGRL